MNEQQAAETTLARSPEETPTVVLGSAPKDGLQFSPGTVLAGRYRVVSLIGRGGMGEVYRADDLKLGQPVALKFLAHRIVERHLLDEVRVGRQISHPNVCRFYDIAEVEGRSFITMEFVDGEDLASLLRRIGRLPYDKALSLTRDLCAGLAAAHDGNVIHRDLKPGNVMVDGRGRARITDFGLAIRGDAEGAAVNAGTPAYMAPEQLSGEAASVRSDIYALGLVTYEVFTGRRAFESKSIHDLIARQQAHDFSAPSSLVKEMDGAVDRVIRQCLEVDPARRPQSVDEVLRALPGGDALSAAVAAGETPSPEMVAAAGARGDLSARTAWASLTSLAIALIAYAALTETTMLHRLTPALKPPEVLEERAREIIRIGNPAAQRGDSTRLFAYDRDAWQWMRANPQTDVQPFEFLYRQSPLPMRSLTLEQFVDGENPPLAVSGMASVRLDSAGKLLELILVPPQLERAPSTTKNVDWSPFLTAAGVANVRPAVSEWAAPVAADETRAWTHGSLRIEAAAYHGRPVWFVIIRPWERPWRMPGQPLDRYSDVAQSAFILTLAIASFSACFLAMRNLRRAHVDRRGAFRIALFVFVVCVVTLLLRAHHAGGMRELAIFLKVLAYSTFIGVTTWLGYIAVEPLVRRRWPRMLIAWSRLLSGRFRDPMIGRDVLVGIGAGIVVAMIRELTALAPGAEPLALKASSLARLTQAVQFVARDMLAAVVLPVSCLALILVLRIATRSVPAAAVLTCIIGAAGTVDMTAGPLGVRVLAGLAVSALTVFLFFRVGLLAVSVSTFVTLLLISLPITLDTSAWYFGRSAFALALILGLAVAAFVISLGGKRWLPEIAVE